jgi:hypothetical protein
MLLPFPNAAQEFLAADILPGRPLGVELALDDDLRRDTGVIRSGLPNA